MKHLIFLAIVVLSTSASLYLSGCAGKNIFSGASREKNGPNAVGGNVKVITFSKDGDPLKQLEQELSTVHTDKVVISTQLLKALVKNEKVVQAQCKDISGQLEAIKNVDLEEPTTN